MTLMYWLYGWMIRILLVPSFLFCLIIGLALAVLTVGIDDWHELRWHVRDICTEWWEVGL